VAGGSISYLPGNSSVASRSESMKGSFVLNLMRSVGMCNVNPIVSHLTAIHLFSQITTFPNKPYPISCFGDFGFAVLVYKSWI